MTDIGTVWYYAKGNQQHGPVGVEVVRRLLASGELSPSDLVWTGGMPEWSEAQRVEGLMPVMAPPPPPPPGMGPASSREEPHHAPMPPHDWHGGHPGAGVGAEARGPIGYRPGDEKESQHGRAVGALVCGICSLACAPAGIGLILGIVAIALSSSATSNMARSGNYDGRGLAQAGLYTGIAGLILSGLVCGGFGVLL